MYYFTRERCLQRHFYRCSLITLLYPILAGCVSAGKDSEPGVIPQMVPVNLMALPAAALRSVEAPAVSGVLAAAPIAGIDSPIDAALYSVVVNRVAASEILLSLAQDSKLDLDIVGDIAGDVTLHAVNQPLLDILEKMSRQVPLIYEVSATAIVVRADLPVVETYNVDYLNISRTSRSSVDLATQVGSIGTPAEGNTAGSGSNGSQMRIENHSENRFWRSLTGNIAGILGEIYEDDAAAESSTGNIFVNRESGLISVRATHRQHQVIRQLIQNAVGSAQRQVLIEATVVEVTLSDNFESGVDWRLLNNSGSRTTSFAQLLTGSPRAAEATTQPSGLITLTDPLSRLGDVTATLKLLQQFGDVQVLSSPKIIALNNQPAVLKVVDNRVYFTFEVERLDRDNGDQRTLVDSTVHSVPVGLVMNVTPFINQNDEVILNVRPTISRILNFAEDPSPVFAGQSEVRNLIPEIQVREMESLLRVASGKVAIIGGLMQNKVDKRNTGLPGLGRLPLLGKVFSHDVNNLEKTELLVFLRPTVLHEPGSQTNADRLGRFVPNSTHRLLMENNDNSSGLPR